MVMRVFVAGGTGVVRRPPASLVKLIHKMAPPGIYDATWPCRGGDRIPVSCCCSLGRLTGGADPLPGREAAVGVVSG
jgi:hypothetical protein